MKFVLIDNKISQDGWSRNDDPSKNSEMRRGLSDPVAVFKTLRGWHGKDKNRYKTHPDSLYFMTSKFDVAKQARVATESLILENAAFVMSGTTGDLEDALANRFGYGINSFRCAANDVLMVMYARVRKLEVGMLHTATETVIHIAPRRSWWDKNGAHGQVPQDMKWKYLVPARDEYISIQELTDKLDVARNDPKSIDIAAKFW